MEIKEITVSRSARVNIGNYEGLEHFMSVKATIDALDDPEEVHTELSGIAERALVTQLVRSYKVRGKKDMDIIKVAKHHGLSWIPKLMEK